MSFEFKPFPKIPRLLRDVVITEKIDGTNAQIAIATRNTLEADISDIYDALLPLFIDQEWEIEKAKEGAIIYGHLDGTEFVLRPASKSRYLTERADNFGFWKWCRDNASELFKLGPGRHYGEWWGQGIQRGYGLTEKRFSLFNAGRWTAENVPACVSVVPTIVKGSDSGEYGWMELVRGALVQLKLHGSHAADGFMNPEGIVVYHTAGDCLFKATLEKDGEPKTKK